MGVALVQLLATAHMITGRQRMCMRQCACVNVSISSSLADRACARLPSRSRVIEVGGWQSRQPPARPLAPALPASVWAAGIWGQLVRPARVCMPWCLYHSRSQGLHWCPHMQGLARDLRGLSGCAQTVCAAGSLRYRHAGGAQSLPSLLFAPRLQRKRAEGRGRRVGGEDALVDPRESGLLACLDVAQRNELRHHRPPLALACSQSACPIAASRRPLVFTLVASAPVVSTTHQGGARKRAAPATANCCCTAQHSSPRARSLVHSAFGALSS